MNQTNPTHEQRLLIDGRLRPAENGKTLDVLNPATGQVAGVMADASPADVEEAIVAARRAFDTTDWSTDHAFRQRCLRQLHDAIVEEQEELRAELVTEVGAPVSTTYTAQLDWPLSDGLLWPAQAIESIPWVWRNEDTERMGTISHRWVLKEAIGVVAAILPWNFPFEILVNKLGPSLATGNTVIVKAASETPWNAARVGRLIKERTDIPDGVVNVLTTRERAGAQRLLSDPCVDMVSFTGSTATGQLVLEKSASTFKRTLLELGGKSASIVLDDADLQTAVFTNAVAACMHAGQGCALPTRMLVHRSHYDEAVAALVAFFTEISYGDPTDPSILIGPIVSARQRDRILDLIDTVRTEKSGRILVGGHAPTNQGEGFFVEPTLIVDVDNTSTIAQEEVFGPVLAVTPFDDDEDAIHLANESRYGLSGTVFSATPERAARVVRGVRTGSFTVNGGTFYGADSPYGGYKASGIGRQGGREGLETYLETKAVGSTIPLPLS